MRTRSREHRPTTRASRPAAERMGAGPGALQPRAPLDASPRLAEQRARLQGIFGPTLQAQPEEEVQMRTDPVAQAQVDEELLQGQGLEEETLQGQGFDDEEALQGQGLDEEPLQAQQGPGSTAGDGGLPAGLQAGVESLSGRDMSDVRVHRGSAEPARVGALAFARGSDIHLGPGQEKHLPHEAWHVAQQKEGRVRPTLQLGGVAVNDDPGLEREADVMGARALQGRWDGAGSTTAKLRAPRPQG